MISVTGKLSLFFCFCFHTEIVVNVRFLKFDVASCYEENEVVDFFVYVLYLNYSRLLSLCTSTCVRINVVFLCFKYFDQKLSYLVPPSSPTPHWALAVDSVGYWTQSNANNFLINFLFLCVS